MAIGHNQAVVADNGMYFGSCTPIDGDTFPDGGMMSNLGRSDFTYKLQVLWNAGNNSSGKYTAIVPNPRSVEYDCMGVYVTIVTDNDILFYHCKRLDNYMLPDL
jgi:hypothetical protein